MSADLSDTGTAGILSHFKCKLCGVENGHDPSCEVFRCPHCGVLPDDAVAHGHATDCPNHVAKVADDASSASTGGTGRRVRDYVTVVLDEDGNPVRAFTTGRDIEEGPFGDDEKDESVAPDGFRSTDAGNSGRFTKVAKGRIKHVHAWGKWLYLQRGRWVLDEGDVLVKELGKQVGRDILKLAAEADVTRKEAATLFQWGLQTEGSGRITAMVHLSRGSPGILVEHEELDADPEILNVRNGTIDLRAGQLRPHNPADLCTMQVPIAYDPDAWSELWEQCLETWQPDEEMRNYLQLEAGAAATGYSTETLSVHWGGGANGKSRFWGAIADTLGPYSVVPHKSLLVAQRHEQHGTEIAKLFRKRLAVASETDAGARLADERIKNLTGNDRQTGRRMREDPWEFAPSHTLVLFSNHKPQVQGQDEGIWRRLRLIPWAVTIPEADRDERLAEKLRRERNAVLAWIIEGARRYLNDGLAAPDTVRKATEQYRSEENVAKRFVDEQLTITGRGDHFTKSSDIGREAETWAEAEGINTPSMKDIAALLRESGCTDRRRFQSRGWVGIVFQGEHIEDGETQ